MASRGPTAEAELNEHARGIGKTIGDALPADVLFCLILVNQGEGGFLSWISNGNREDMLTALREMILKVGDEPPGKPS